MQIEKTERPIRLDFNTDTRKVVEVYEISPDGKEIRTSDGWVSAFRLNMITQRPVYIPEASFITDKQIEWAIKTEYELLKEKKHKHTAAYIVAKKYPIKDWFRSEGNNGKS